MGRTERSQGLAPPAIRKDIRAKQARHIVNKVIPAILASSARARKGAEGSELIVDPGPVKYGDGGSGHDAEEDGEGQYAKRKGQGRRKINAGDEVVVREGYHNGKEKSKGRRRNGSLDENLSSLSVATASSDPAFQAPNPTRTIRIITTDTLTAAHMLTFPFKYINSLNATTAASKKKEPNTLILNMASPLRPGGGVITGATSQEEFLCARTTLLPSLKETYYRLPEFGGIYTHDVLVFRNSSQLGTSKGAVGPGERYWVDVISAGMLRFPDLEGEEEVKRLGKKDREVVEKKMRAVLRIACSKGLRKVVLGAWGCGAYGNPVPDIARAWRNVLNGDSPSTTNKKKMRIAEEVGIWDQLEEIVFAISNARLAQEFAHHFGGLVEVERGPGGHADVDDNGEGEEEDKATEEVRVKIAEMESQVAQVWNPDLKARMGSILDGLRVQLQEREGANGRGRDEEQDEDGDNDSEADLNDDDERRANEGNDDEVKMINNASRDSSNVECEEDEEDGSDSSDDAGVKVLPPR